MDAVLKTLGWKDEKWLLICSQCSAIHPGGYFSNPLIHSDVQSQHTLENVSWRRGGVGLEGLFISSKNLFTILHQQKHSSSFTAHLGTAKEGAKIYLEKNMTLRCDSIPSRNAKNLKFAVKKQEMETTECYKNFWNITKTFFIKCFYRHVNKFFFFCKSVMERSIYIIVDMM